MLRQRGSAASLPPEDHSGSKLPAHRTPDHNTSQEHPSWIFVSGAFFGRSRLAGAGRPWYRFVAGLVTSLTESIKLPRKVLTLYYLPLGSQAVTRRRVPRGTPSALAPRPETPAALLVPGPQQPGAESADRLSGPSRNDRAGERAPTETREAEDGQRRISIADLLSVGSALYAFPAVVVTTLDFPVPVKLFWLLCLLVPAGLVTWFILERPHAAPQGQSRVRGLMKRAVLPLAAVASVVVSLLSVRVVEMHLPLAAELGCVAVGSGDQDYAEAFQAAYTAAGGEAKLGCAITPVTPWVGGYQQTLQGPGGQSVITALDPAHVIVLDADEYQGFQDIAGQGTSFLQAGYPISKEIPLRHGSEILIGGGDPDHEPSALLKQINGQWYWVSSSFWATYLDQFGGPGGSYGYPISKQAPFDNGLRQFFQHGWLFYRADVGVLTAHQYALFRAGKFHPAPNRATFPSIIPGLKVADVYEVDSNRGVSYDLKPGQSAEQAFTSTLPYVDQMGVIVGLNPLNNFHPQQHYLRIQILARSGKSVSSEIAALSNNVNTVVQVPDVGLKTGTTYYIRVTNLSGDVLGVYLNDPRRAGEKAGHDGNAVVNGITEPGVLAAFVEGRSIRS